MVQNVMDVWELQHGSWRDKSIPARALQAATPQRDLVPRHLRGRRLLLHFTISESFVGLHLEPSFVSCRRNPAFCPAEMSLLRVMHRDRGRRRRRPRRRERRRGVHTVSPLHNPFCLRVHVVWCACRVFSVPSPLCVGLFLTAARRCPFLCVRLSYVA